MRKRAKPVEVRLDARTSKRVGFLLHLVTIELKYEPFAYVISLQKAKLNVMKIVYHGFGRAWCVFLSTHGTSRKALDQAPNLGKTWFDRNRGHSQARSSAYYSMLQPCLNTFLFRSFGAKLPRCIARHLQVAVDGQIFLTDVYSASHLPTQSSRLRKLLR